MNNTKDILKIIADNPALTEALKKEFEGIYNADDFDTSVDNETLGQNVRAFQMMKIAVAQVFKDIATYKTVKSREEQPNPAR